MGVRWVVSTWALLAAKPKKLISYDINYHPNIEQVKAAETETDFTFIKADVLTVDIEPTDMLFIDTWHIARQLKEELRLHANKVRRYLVFHDTTTFGNRGEDGGDGLWPVIDSFVNDNPDWVIKERLTNNNGLTILERVSTRVKPKVKWSSSGDLRSSRR
jgi:hypothetical protein